MQSDKHLNNVQTLQNGGSEAQYNHNHANPVVSAGLGAGCGAPSPSKPKQKPTWRCEVTKKNKTTHHCNEVATQQDRVISPCVAV